MLRPLRLRRNPRDDRGENLFRSLGVGEQVLEYGLRRDRFFLNFPAIVIGDHPQGGEGDLGFAGEFRLRQVGHADDVEAMAAIQLRFRAGGKGGTIHVDISAAIVDAQA